MPVTPSNESGEAQYPSEGPTNSAEAQVDGVKHSSRHDDANESDAHGHDYVRSDDDEPSDDDGFNDVYEYSEVDVEDLSDYDIDSVDTHGQTLLDWPVPAPRCHNHHDPLWPKDAQGRILYHPLILAENDEYWGYEKVELVLLWLMSKCGYFDIYHDPEHDMHHAVFKYCNSIRAALQRAFEECEPKVDGTRAQSLQENAAAHFHLAKKLRKRLRRVVRARRSGGHGLDETGERVHWTRLIPPQHEVVAHFVAFPGCRVDGQVAGFLVELGAANMLPFPLFDRSQLPKV